MVYRFQRNHAALKSGNTLTVQLKRETPVPIFFRQGDIDSACGLHVFAMVLSIMGLAKSSALDDMTRRQFGVPANVWSVFQHTYFSGVNHDEYVDLIESLDLPLETKLACGKSGNIDGCAAKWLMQTDLVALAFASVKNQRTKHWALAVGIEGDAIGRENIADTILLLDPSGPEPVFSTFNARLCLRRPSRQSRNLPANPLNTARRLKAINWLYESSEWSAEPVRLLAAVRLRRKATA